jgi:hypothetical protein
MISDRKYILSQNKEKQINTDRITGIVQLATKIALSDCVVQFEYNGIVYTGDEYNFEGSRFTVQSGDTYHLVSACWKPDIFMVVLHRADAIIPLVLRQASWDKLQFSASDAARLQAESLKAEAAKVAKNDTVSETKTSRSGRKAKAA